jgi:hypothetical protein
VAFQEVEILDLIWKFHLFIFNWVVKFNEPCKKISSEN